MSPISNEDQVVIQNVLRGDTNAYATLVRRYQPRVIRLCTSMLRNATEAEDAAQEVFIKAYQSLRDFKESSAFYTWLYRIASNHCLSILRSHKRQSTQSLDSLIESNKDAAENLFAVPEGTRSRLESTDILNKVLSALPDNYRLALILRESEGLSYEEMTVAMGCSLDSVKAQLRRARQEVSEKLRHFWPDRSV